MIIARPLTIFALLALGGCANELLSDEAIRTSTALVLTEPASSVRISDRRYDGVTTTYYTAATTRRTYHCTIDGGTIGSFGLANPPVCNR